MTTAVARDIPAQLTDHLSRQLGAGRYRRWLGDAQLEWADGQLIVTAPNRYAAELIARNCRAALTDAAADYLGSPAPVQIIAANTAPSNGQTPSASHPSTAPAPRRAPRRTPRPASTAHCLDDFVVGQCNRMAYQIARRAAEATQRDHNPLVFYGGCGVGKTHLLQGLCRQFGKTQPHKRCAYLTAEQFTNDYIEAVRTHQLSKFRARLRSLDMLVVDDVQFLSNKTGTQSEFHHTFDQLSLRGATLVMACDVYPRQLGDFSERLLNRFISGMIVNVPQPDTETRMKIISTLGARQGLVMREQVLPALAEHCRGSVRDIQGTLNLLKALAREDRQHPSDGTTVVGHALIDRLLGASRTVRPARPIRFDTILRQVCDYLQVDRALVQSGRRQKLIVLARSLVGYLTRQLTPMSYPEIARALRRPNHTTIITACQRVEGQLAEDQHVHLPAQQRHVQLAQLIEELRGRITSASPND